MQRKYSLAPAENNFHFYLPSLYGFFCFMIVGSGAITTIPLSIFMKFHATTVYEDTFRNYHTVGLLFVALVNWKAA